MTPTSLFSQRRMMYMLLLSYMGFAAYITSFHEALSFHQIPSSLTEIVATAPVTVFEQQTATQSAGSQHEVEQPLRSHLFRWISGG